MKEIMTLRRGIDNSTSEGFDFWFERSLKFDNLFGDEEVEYVERHSRKTGTGMVDVVYRFCNTDTALIIHKGCVSCGEIFDSLEIVPDFFAERRRYAQKCGKASRKHKVPFEVCLAVGPEYIEELASKKESVKKISQEDSTEAARLINEMSCGIHRRKVGIVQTLFSKEEIDSWYDRDMDEYELPQKFISKIDGMGQENSNRLANYLIKLLG